DVEPEGTLLTSMASGVLVWSGGRGHKLLVTAPGADPAPVNGPVRSASAVLPGPGGTVWVTTGGARYPSGRTTWTEADQERATGGRVEVRGLAVPDGAGGLFDVDPTTVRHVHPGPPRDLGAGHVLAVGPDGYT